MDMEGNIAKTYTLIYSFLKKRSHPKAAEAVKKAAKGVVVLKDDVEHRGPELDEIVKEWGTKQIKKVSFAVTDSSSDSEESSDDSDSSSGSDSSSSSSSASDPKPKSKPGVVSKGASSSSEDEDSSDTNSEKQEVVKSKPSKQIADRITNAKLSSAGNAKPEGSARQQLKFQKEPNPKSLASDSSQNGSSDSDVDSGSDSDSDSCDSSSDEGTISKVATKQTPHQGPAASTCSSSSSESSSSSSESSSESSSDSDDETSKNDHKRRQPCANTPNVVQKSSRKDKDTQATKKRKISESGAAVVTAVDAENNGGLLHQKGGKPPRKANDRFQRVKPQAVVPELIVDNGYEAKTRTQNDYGERAHRDLIVTRGAGFRKEKNKKKRGSYRGGEITLENHSIKFDY